MITIDTLFVPGIQPVQKHPTVFRKFDELEIGDSFLLINDHDPIPLFFEMKAERGEVFDWKKIEDGPITWKVEITKTANAAAKPSGFKETNQDSSAAIFDLNVTLIEPAVKHPTIFKYFDALKAGEGFVITNDHDPKPLFYQLQAERGDVFTWSYLEKGPEWWKVYIKKNNAEQKLSVGQMVAKDIRKATVFKKYGIDFCCGGKKSLEQVCEEKGLEVEKVRQELENVHVLQPSVENYNSWNIAFLADYIYNKHHEYYYQEGPIIKELLEKVAGKHGSHFPELIQVQALYLNLAHELSSHFEKEESIVFPFVKALAEAKKIGNKNELKNIFSLSKPIQMMESEHEEAGEILAELNTITNNYTAPEGACNSFQFLYLKLKDLENDLHQHIHLENNILFPKALQLEKELRTE